LGLIILADLQAIGGSCGGNGKLSCVTSRLAFALALAPVPQLGRRDPGKLGRAASCGRKAARRPQEANH